MNEFRPMAVIHADLIGKIREGKNSRGQRGYQYILSVVDVATRYLWSIPLLQKSADAVATALFEDVIVRSTTPSAILTDRGMEFLGEVVEQLCEKLGISHLKTTSYHSQTDSKCERVHRSIHDMVTKLVKDKPDYWPDLLSPVCQAYNSTVHTSTGYAPHELFFSFPPACSLDILAETPSYESADSADRYALQATERLRQASSLFTSVLDNEPIR